MPKFTFSSCCYIKKMIFWPNTYWFVLSYSFQAFVWLQGLTMPSSSGMIIYRNRLGTFGPWTFGRVIFVPLFSRFVLVQFLGHSGLSWVSAAPYSGHLDPMIIPLSFCRKSKVVLASTNYLLWRYLFSIDPPIENLVKKKQTNLLCSFQSKLDQSVQKKLLHRPFVILSVLNMGTRSSLNFCLIYNRANVVEFSSFWPMQI